MLVNYLNKNTSHKIKYNKNINYLGANFQASDTRTFVLMYPIR